jgi:NAD(P)-dependent dehydrogenase (short-subunit alcohol dehydrogenase family)
MRIAGKRVIITGAASGIGQAGVELFTREGATVAAIDIDGAALERTVAAVREAGGQVIGIPADLSDRKICQRAITQAIDELGGIDIVWLHAGIALLGDFDGLDLDQFDKASELNITGPVIAIGIAMRRIRAQGTGGSIVLTASVSGLVGSKNSAVYSIHKFGVVGMAKSLALSLAKDGVRVNAICPGFTHTPGLLSVLSEKGGPGGVEPGLIQLSSNIPLGRLGKSDEIAQAALWLASDDASYVTGVALPVDGGYTAI